MNAVQRFRLVIMLIALFPTSTALGAGGGISGSTAKALDANINGKSLSGGYTMKGWMYKPNSGEFILYVLDGKKWQDEYIATGGLPQHGSIAVLIPALILEQDGGPTPKVYIVKDGNRELFRLDAEQVVEKIKDAQMR
jgi:hypothetical protein